MSTPWTPSPFHSPTRSQSVGCPTCLDSDHVHSGGESGAQAFQPELVKGTHLERRTEVPSLQRYHDRERERSRTTIEDSEPRRTRTPVEIGSGPKTHRVRGGERTLPYSGTKVCVVSSVILSGETARQDTAERTSGEGIWGRRSGGRS